MTPKLVPQSLAVFYSIVTYAPWREIPTTYVLCENDCAVKLPFVESLIDAAKATGNHKIDTLERCDAGHFVMNSRPEWLADILRRAAWELLGTGDAWTDSDMREHKNFRQRLDAAYLARHFGVLQPRAVYSIYNTHIQILSCWVPFCGLYLITINYICVLL